jgi:curved DNA-binding protein CbpA
MMEASDFIDYYEILEISPNANSGSVERMFRYLAQRHHPDNPDTGDRLRFDLVLEANATLKDPVKRAQYDIRYKHHSGLRLKLAEEANDHGVIQRDADIQNKLMSIFYVKRRQNVNDPGVAEFELERLLDCPAEHFEFHLWYLKAKGWIARNDNGMLAITIEGVDRAHSEHHEKTPNRRLTDGSEHKSPRS